MTQERLSSSEVDPALRFDVWRERAHQWVEMLPLPPGAELDADIVILRSQACIFGTMRSSAYAMRAASHRLAHAPDMLVVTLIQAGELVRDDAPPGEAQRAGPGALGLYDPWRIGDYRWSQGSRETFLALPRDEVRAALGREPGNVPIPLERCALAPALASQLNHLALLARQPQKLDNQEYATLLDGTRELALLTLRNLGRQGEAAPGVMDDDLNAGRYEAAVRFMEREAHKHDLDAAAIARGAGCSRTRLYAAFAARDETVMGVLRELRLQRAKAMIERSPRLHIGSLSWRCGFADQSTFSKLYRLRFGMLPSEWHHRTWTAPVPEAVLGGSRSDGRA